MRQTYLRHATVRKRAQMGERYCGAQPSGSILYISSNVLSGRTLEDYLRRHLYDVAATQLEDAVQAVASIDDRTVVIVDATGAGGSWLSLCRGIRARSTAPIIAAASDWNLERRIAGLEAGADDCIPKPIALPELLEKIRAIERRVALSRNPRDDGIPKAYRFADWHLDMHTRAIRHCDGSLRTLTNSEFALLRMFVANPMETIDRTRLQRAAYGEKWDAISRNIDTQICRLRRTLRDNVSKSSPRLISNIYGKGYILLCSVIAE